MFVSSFTAKPEFPASATREPELGLFDTAVICALNLLNEKCRHDNMILASLLVQLELFTEFSEAHASKMSYLQLFCFF